MVSLPVASQRSRNAKKEDTVWQTLACSVFVVVRESSVRSEKEENTGPTFELKRSSRSESSRKVFFAPTRPF